MFNINSTIDFIFILNIVKPKDKISISLVDFNIEDTYTIIIVLIHFVIIGSNYIIYSSSNFLSNYLMKFITDKFIIIINFLNKIMVIINFVSNDSINSIIRLIGIRLNYFT